MNHTTHTDREAGPEPDMSAVLASATDPLQLAADLARRTGDLMALRAALAKYGARPGARVLHSVARQARASAASQDAADLVAHSLATGTAAGLWFAACLEENLGNTASAADILLRVTDVRWGEERAMVMLTRARNLLKCGRLNDAWLCLQYASRSAETRQTIAAIDQLMDQVRVTFAPPVRAKRKIAVIGSGTLGFWASALRPILLGFDIEAEVAIGDYGQYQQEILDPDSAIAAFGPDIVIVAPDWRSLGLADETSDPAATVDRIVENFRSLWRVCHSRFRTDIIQFNFEIPEADPLGRLSTAARTGRGRVLHSLNLRLWEAAESDGVAILDVDAVSGIYGKQKWTDTTMWIAAKQHPASQAVPFLARHVAAVIRAACGLTSKCLVLDLDNTLWGGIIGEDGLAGIKLGGDAEGEAFTAFQKYVKALRTRGIALAVCSKNNEEDARSVFRDHPESVLREADFAGFFANWDPKPDNLRRIAASLNIGLDSLVFVDDNPVERNLVRQELPEVEVPEIGEDPALFAEELHRSGLFEAFVLTDDDRKRADAYRSNADRSAVASIGTDIEAYLASLSMKVALRGFDSANLPRIVQLINKTNQFNLTTRRVTVAEVTAWMEDANCYTQTMRLEDRFGDSGLTGVLIAFHESDTLRIDNWLMSCRVLGRRIENVMIASLFDYARNSGVRTIAGEYIPTAKNGQVCDLYDRLGFTRVESRADGRAIYRLAVANAGRLPLPDCEIQDDTSLALNARA
jgi:FkbH-like protein